MKVTRLAIVLSMLVLNLTSILGFSPTPHKRVDALALSTNGAAEFTNIEDLVQYGRKNGLNEAESLRFYFVWIARNIHYDADELKAEKRDAAKQEPEAVFRQRKAICRGYADLLTVICQKAGIPCRSVAGYTNSGEQAGRDDLHAWNAIEVNQNWYLFDVTWASNYLENGGEIDDRFEGYFSQTAQHFVRRHFPFDPVWQLSDYVLPKDAFFCGDTEGVTHDKTYFGDYKKIISAETGLDWAEQGIRSFERALAFLPDEKRLYEALNYYKSEKAGFQFRQSRILLEKIRNINENDLQNWTMRDVDNFLQDASKAKFLLEQAHNLYQNMNASVNEEEMAARQENLATIGQNKSVADKMIVFLESVKSEIKKIPIARK